MGDTRRPRVEVRKPGKATPGSLGAVDRAVVAFATVGGLGRVQVLGGTLAAVAAVPVWFTLSFFSLGLYGFVVAALLVLGIAAAGRFDRLHESRDDPRIVIDEFVGMLVALLGSARTASSIAAGLILFGLLDVLKPPPIRQLDRQVHGGVGVMGDDLVAGGVAAGLLWVMRWLGFL